MIKKINKNKAIMLLSVIVLLLIFGAAFAFISYQNKAKEIANVLPSKTAAGKTINYINENILVGVSPASLVDVFDEGSVYKIRLKIEDMEFDSYISKDGKFLFPEGYDMEKDLAQAPPVEAPIQTETTSLSEEETKDFIACLAQADFMIYGANWCGWTTSLVSMLGGGQAVEPIYVECTEQASLCQEKEIVGYPTILINGELYQGARTFEDFSETTGCPVPAGAESLGQNNPAGGCQ